MMTCFKKSKAALFLFALLTASVTLHAQLEAPHLFLKGQSATGFGAYLHAGFPVSKGDEVSAEVGFDFFAPNQSHLVFVPLIAGYRHTFDGSGTRFYVEPLAGYCIGTTDIQQVDASGNPVYNSDSSVAYEKLSGPIAGLTIGYIIPSPRYPINFGLRYEHIFVSGGSNGGSSPDMLAFRISWSILTGRRLQQKP